MAINLKELVIIIRKAVKEEVKQSVQEEFAKLDKTLLVERKKTNQPGKINTPVKKQVKQVKQNNIISEEQLAKDPMGAILAITAQEMQGDGSINTWGRDDTMPGMEGDALADLQSEFKTKTNAPKPFNVSHQQQPQIPENEWGVLGDKVLTSEDVIPTTLPIPEEMSNEHYEVDSYEPAPDSGANFADKMKKILKDSYKFDGQAKNAGVAV